MEQEERSLDQRLEESKAARDTEPYESRESLLNFIENQSSGGENSQPAPTIISDEELMSRMS
jgi:hypothetical protein